MDSATRAAREESKLQILRQSVVARVSLLSLAHPDHEEKQNLMVYVSRASRHASQTSPICSLTLTAPLCITIYAQLKAYKSIPLLPPPPTTHSLPNIPGMPPSSSWTHRALLALRRGRRSLLAGFVTRCTLNR
jgi:hypothetical protein